MKRMTALLLAALMLLCSGCAGGEAGDPTPTGSDAPSGSAIPSDPTVHTDWSALTSYQPFKAVEKRWYPGETDTLIPRDDYGPLTTYCVPRLSYTYSWDEDPSAYTYSYNYYGLATLDGTVVTDPVFDYIYQPSVYDFSTEQSCDLPLWVLVRTVTVNGESQQRCALAAQDGSWCTGFIYANPTEGLGSYGDETCLVMVDLEDPGCVLVDLDGGEIFRFSPEDVADPDNEWWMYNLVYDLAPGEGFLCRQIYDEAYQASSAVFYDLSTGAVLNTPALTAAHAFSQGLAAALDTGSGLWGYLSTNGSWAIPPQFSGALSFLQGLAIVTTQDGLNAIIDTQGQILLQLASDATLTRQGGYFQISDSRGFTYLDTQLREVASVGDASVSIYDGWVSYSTGEELVLLHDGTEYRLPVQGSLTGISNGIAAALCYDDQAGEFFPSLVTLEGEILVQVRSSGSAFFTLSDPLSPDAPAYFVLYCDDAYSVYSPRGEALFTTTQYPTLLGGVFQASDDLSYGLRDLDGQWLLRLSDFALGAD